MRRGNNRLILLSAFISFVTFVVFIPSLKGDFVWDDQQYVTGNQNIRSIDIGFIIWSLKAVVVSNWHPLTLFSLALDHAVWGMDPQGFHLTNIILHSLNTILVFFLTIRLLALRCETLDKNGLMAGIFTSLLFGLHPLHVESVAWVSERKDVLCAFFFLLSILAYLRYTEGSERHYRVSIALFAMALLSKPMAVSLPLVLLILDYYPLRRFGKKSLVEKLPFLILAVLSSLATIWAQGYGGALRPLDIYPLEMRVFVAIHSYIFYILRMFLPFGLVPYYPYPKEIILFSMEYLGSIASFIALTLLAVRSFKRGGLFAAAWLYYVITLIPVVGIVQVGGQAAADRYTYLPSLGPFLLAGLAVGRILDGRKKGYKVIAAVVILLGLLSVKTQKQIMIWRDSITLWSYEVKYFPDVPVAYYNRGNAYGRSGSYRQAVSDYTKTIELNPKDAEAHLNRGNSHLILGDYGKALRDIDRAIELDPLYATRHPEVYYNRGLAHFSLGNLLEAIKDYSKAIEFNPRDERVFNNRGNAYARLGRYEEAVSDYDKALELNPGYEIAHRNREAARRLREALRY